jgi:predicted transposase/invertase (TIGR01784 family)
MTYIKPIYDFAFKAVFGDPRDTGNLIGFLSSLGELPGGKIKSVTITDPFFRRLFKKDKDGILDLKAITNSGSTINVEVQLYTHKGLKERIIYYLSRLITEQLRIGSNFTKIKPVVCVIVCDFNMIPESDRYLSRISLWNEDKKEVFTDLVKILIIELPKVPPEDDGKEPWSWLAFLKTQSMEELDMLTKKKPNLADAAGVIRHMSLSDHFRQLAWEMADAKRVHQAILDYQRELGQKEGWDAGEISGIAKNQAQILDLIQKGYTTQQIEEFIRKQQY